MSVTSKAIRGFSWFAAFRFIGQLFSWAATIIVARILSPSDYGLMEMAGIIAGYAGLFSEMGLGAAIIQRPNMTRDELNSIFWFGLMSCSFFAILCVFIAYPTAIIFNEPRVIPVTQVCGIVFLINGFEIVPANLLRKKMDYKTVGWAEMIGVMVSSSCMLVIAWLGGGVWTLIGGHIIRDFTRVCLYYWKTRWIPRLHFVFREVKGFLMFGLAMAIGQSFGYVSNKGDRFFAGRAWSAQMVGYYALALQIAQIPTEKIVSLIGQVSYSALSQLQGQVDKFKNFYINLTKVILTLVMPLYVGGFLVGEELIRVLLGDKWILAIVFFKYLCLAQILKALTPINSHVHAAQGRSNWFLYFQTVNGILLALSFYITVPLGQYGILIPWFTTYVGVFLVWLYLTLKVLRITVSEYLKQIKHPITATILMSGGVILSGWAYNLLHLPKNLIIILVTKVLIGAIIYICYLWTFDRQFIMRLKNVYQS